MTGNTVDLKIGLAGGVIAFTLLEVGATAATPVWVTFAIFSLNHFIQMQPHETADSRPKAAPIKIKS